MRARQSALAGAVLALVLLTGCRVERRERVAVLNPDSVAREEILAASGRYRDALIRGDAALAASFFTDSARVETPGMPSLEGVDAIRGMFRDAFAMARVEDAVLTPQTVDVSPRGVAWEAGTFTERFRMDGQDDAQSVEGTYALRWQRGAESTWLIDRMIMWHPPADTLATADSAAADGAGQN